MTSNAILQLLLYVVVLTALSWPLGRYMAKVFEGQPFALARWLGPLERLIYRASGVRVDEDMSWRGYAGALLAFNLVGLVAVYLLQRLQGALPWNPEHLASTSAHLAFNTAVSFTSNTNWQSYGGETTLSHLTQMLGLTVQNFVSAATGMAVLAALIRGFVRRKASGIGNFWVDMTRSTLYVLLPLSLVLSLVLVSQGVVQSLSPYAKVAVIDPQPGADGQLVTEQTLALGPAASQVAIKQLGTNGGGFFNVNSAHPLENPTPLSNFVKLLSILLV